MSDTTRKPIDPIIEAGFLALAADRNYVAAHPDFLKSLRDQQTAFLYEQIKTSSGKTADLLRGHFRVSTSSDEGRLEILIKRIGAASNKPALGTMHLHHPKHTADQLTVGIGNEEDSFASGAFRVVVEKARHTDAGTQYDCQWQAVEHFGSDLLEEDECVGPGELLTSEELKDFLLSALFRACQRVVPDPVEEQARPNGGGIF